jgi:hypothetical protein
VGDKTLTVKSREAAIRRTERAEQASQRLETIRASLRAQTVSYGELTELQSLTAYIAPGDTELLEAAGVPEFPSGNAARWAELDARPLVYPIPAACRGCNDCAVSTEGVRPCPAHATATDAPATDAEWLYGDTPAGLRQRAAEDLAAEFGTDPEEWLV